MPTAAPRESRGGSNAMVGAVPRGRPRSCHAERLDIPLRLRKPTCFFGNSMRDLFHEEVPGSFILSILRVATHAPQHLFQFLRKGAERTTDFFDEYRHIICEDHMYELPLSNVWLGVSVENQCFADEGIPLLLQTPAAVRFLFPLSPRYGQRKRPVGRWIRQEYRRDYCPGSFRVVGGASGMV